MSHAEIYRQVSENSDVLPENFADLNEDEKMLISQARKVEMTHFKRPKSSTGCGQCWEALGKGPTPSRGSGMHQEGLLFGKITRGREIFSVDLTVCKLQTC